MKNLILALFFFTISLYSCNPDDNEPTVEGGVEKIFDYKKQTRSFRVLTASGKPYNHKIGWDIIAILEDNSSNILSNKVDTLSNGDLRISYDWVCFTVKNRKTIIEVSVQENVTGKDRIVYFATENTNKQIFLPNLRITQRGKQLHHMQ